MQMTGKQRIAASRERVWQALNDPEVLRRCIPGCQSLDKEADGRLRGVVEIKIGPIGARFNGLVTLSDVDPLNGYTISGEGQGGTVGSAKGGAKVRLIDDAGGTLLSYDVDAQVGGRLAQLGGPLIDATAKQLADKFFKEFGQQVAGGATAKAATAPAAAPAPQAAAAPSGFPIAWVLALIVAVLAGFEVARGEWLGIAVAVGIAVAAIVGFIVGKGGSR